MLTTAADNLETSDLLEKLSSILEIVRGTLVAFRGPSPVCFAPAMASEDVSEREKYLLSWAEQVIRSKNSKDNKITENNGSFTDRTVDWKNTVNELDTIMSAIANIEKTDIALLSLFHPSSKLQSSSTGNNGDNDNNNIIFDDISIENMNNERTKLANLDDSSADAKLEYVKDNEILNFILNAALDPGEQRALLDGSILANSDSEMASDDNSNEAIPYVTELLLTSKDESPFRDDKTGRFSESEASSMQPLFLDVLSYVKRKMGFYPLEIENFIFINETEYELILKLVHHKIKLIDAEIYPVLEKIIDRVTFFLTSHQDCRGSHNDSLIDNGSALYIIEIVKFFLTLLNIPCRVLPREIQ